MKNLRIIWAITAKDLTDSIKNKNILGVILPALFMVVAYRYLPLLTRETRPPALFLYAPGRYDIVESLDQSPSFRLRNYPSEEEMLLSLTDSDDPDLGLVIPDDFPALPLDSQQTIEGFMLQYFPDDQISTIESYAETELSALFQSQVDLQISRIPLQENSHGIAILASLGLTFVVFSIGVVTIPHLFLEEKTEKTIDAILVSPANDFHIVVGKTLTGLIYTLIIFVVSLFLFSNLIQHFWLALAGALLGSFVAVLLGMMLGIVIENRQQLSLWGYLIIIPLFIPMILVLLQDLFPPWLIQGLKFLPTTALMRVFRTSMAASITAPYYLPQLGYILTAAVLVLGFDSWLLKRKRK